MKEINKMTRVKIRIPIKLLTKIEKLKQLNGMSRNEKIVTLLRLGLAKRMGYKINLKYLKLEDTLQILDDALRLDEIPYSVLQCPRCEGIITHNSDVIKCLKCGSTFKLHEVKK
jgi:ribosomal protein S27AE